MQLAGEAELASKAHVQVTEHSEAGTGLSDRTGCCQLQAAEIEAGEERQEEPSGGRRSGRRRLSNGAVT